MGNTAGRDRLQQMDDGGPTLFQPRQIQGYPGSLDNEYDVTSKVYILMRFTTN